MADPAPHNPILRIYAAHGSVGSADGARVTVTVHADEQCEDDGSWHEGLWLAKDGARIRYTALIRPPTGPVYSNDSVWQVDRRVAPMVVLDLTHGDTHLYLAGPLIWLAGDPTLWWEMVVFGPDVDTTTPPGQAAIQALRRRGTQVGCIGARGTAPGGPGAAIHAAPTLARLVDWSRFYIPHVVYVSRHAPDAAVRGGFDGACALRTPESFWESLAPVADATTGWPTVRDWRCGAETAMGN